MYNPSHKYIFNCIFPSVNIYYKNSLSFWLFINININIKPHLCSLSLHRDLHFRVLFPCKEKVLRCFSPFFQLSSCWITVWRCTCGRAGSLKTSSAPALQRCAGTRRGSVPWRRCCSTAKVRGHRQGLWLKDDPADVVTQKHCV